MKRPWQIWLLFGLCLAMVLPGMAWLTHKALQLDRAEALAQRQADLEEAVGSALWQMDSELTRLLAAEIARPVSFYRSFFPVANDSQGGKRQLASPLLRQPSPYVRLHFELHPDSTWSSPQCPDQDQYAAALANDATPENIDRSNRWLQQLAQSVRYDDLIARLPQQNLEADLPAQNVWAMNNALLPSPQQSQVVKNTLDLEPVQQQLESVQMQVPVDFEQQQQAAGPNAYNQMRNQRLQQRRGNELQNRNEALQAAAQQAIWDQRWNYPQTVPERLEVLGVSQPLWIGSRLLLARRVESSGQSLIQGCWLDWPRIKSELLERISPLLPRADLEPVLAMEEVRFSRVLATLPVQVVVPDAMVAVNPLSPIRISLLVAWGFLTLATIAMAVLLRGVVSLSERRAAFVSAVTHELRTPLTTFRMYAEMLAEGMVADDQQRILYLETLKVEADRLTHLVENVLQYARLERGASGNRREAVSVDSLLQRIEPRLRDRAEQAGMTIVVEDGDGVRHSTVATDPGAVEQILFNLVDNACKYARENDDRRIHCRLDTDPRAVRIEIRDHGPGIPKGQARQLFRPFSKSAQAAANSAPGVGLGLALSRQLASQIGGRLEIAGHEGDGATFTLRLPRSMKK